MRTYLPYAWSARKIFWTSVHKKIRKNEVPLKRILRSMRSFFLQNYLNRSYSEALLTTSKLACLCGTTPFLCRRHILSCESMIEKSGYGFSFIWTLWNFKTSKIEFSMQNHLVYCFFQPSTTLKGTLIFFRSKTFCV